MDEVFVRINGKTHYLWRAVDHEGEVLEVFATKRQDWGAALEFLKCLLNLLVLRMGWVHAAGKGGDRWHRRRGS